MAQPDLRFLMERENVPERLQDEVYKIGIQTVRQFAALSSTAADLASVCKEFGTDPATGLVARVAASKFTVAWESAKVRAAKQAEAEADRDIRAVPKPLWSTELATMKKTCQKGGGGHSKIRRCLLIATWRRCSRASKRTS